MRLTVIGCWGGSPRPGGACAGYLLEHDGCALLLDCGSGVASAVQLVRPLVEIDHVIVSHYHYDHVSDAGVLMFARLVRRIVGEAERDLVFYALDDGAPNVGQPGGELSGSDLQGGDQFAHLTMEGASCAVAIDEGSEVRVGPFACTFMRTKHPVDCLAMRVSCDDGTSLGYTADGALAPGLASFMAGVDVLVSECSLYAGVSGEPMGHMSCDDVARLAAQVRPRTLVLSHLPVYGEVSELRDRVVELLAADDGADGQPVANDGLAAGGVASAGRGANAASPVPCEVLLADRARDGSEGRLVVEIERRPVRQKGSCA